MSKSIGVIWSVLVLTMLSACPPKPPPDDRIPVFVPDVNVSQYSQRR